MCSLQERASRRKLTPQDIVCRSETVRRGEVLPVGNVCRWVARPEPHGTGWPNAVLEGNGTLYAASGFHTDNGEGVWWLVVDLRKEDGTHYRLTFGPDGEHCSCPQYTFRGCCCKHRAVVRAALDWLEQAERSDWSDALDDGAAPF